MEKNSTQIVSRHIATNKKRLSPPYPFTDDFRFPEDIGNPRDIACKIVWSEYAGGETHASYVFSKGFSEKDKQAAMEEIDDIVVNENDNVPK